MAQHGDNRAKAGKKEPIEGRRAHEQKKERRELEKQSKEVWE